MSTVKDQVGLLDTRDVPDLCLHAGFVEAVLAEQSFQRLDGLNLVRVEVRRSQTQFGGAGKLPAIGRLLHSAYYNASHEIGALRDEFENDSIAGLSGVDCQIGITSGRE